MCDVIRDPCLMGQFTKNNIKNEAVLSFVVQGHSDLARPVHYFHAVAYYILNLKKITEVS
jgi:hypothetical protein